jgi:hypothetical protein
VLDEGERMPAKRGRLEDKRMLTMTRKGRGKEKLVDVKEKGRAATHWE